MAKSRIIFIGVLLVLIAQKISAQEGYYFLAFKDKLNNGYSVNQPHRFLSQKSIDRRLKQNISIIEQDLPITESYKDSLIEKGIEVFEASKWFNGVIIKGSEEEVDLLKEMTFVTSITYIAPESYYSGSGQKNRIPKEEVLPPARLFQNKILNIEHMHSQGYYGKGITIAVIDGGFNNVDSLFAFNHLYSNNQLKYTYNFFTKSADVYWQSSSHGTCVLSFMAAQKDTIFQGIAPKADYLLFVTEYVKTEYKIEEYYWLMAAERADSAGSDIINSSLGYYNFEDSSMDYTKDDLDGNTAVSSRAAHIASEKGIIVVVAVGNSGFRGKISLGVPSDIKNGLAVGNIDDNYTRNPNSSMGPSSDGRIKPDVVAMGTQAYYIESHGNVVRGNGTSFSSPQVAALAAGIWEANPSYSYLEVIESIRMSASNSNVPNNEIGYGIPSFKKNITSLQSLYPEKSMSVYPNPISETNTLKIRLTSPAIRDSIQVEIYETSGKKITAKMHPINEADNSANIDIKNIKKGTYILKVLFDTKKEEFRIIKL